MSNKQKNLDCLAILFFLSGLLAYVFTLKEYVREIPGNIILLLFMASPGMAVLKALRAYPYRIAVSKMNADGVYFLMALLLAGYLKEGYTAYATALAKNPDVIADLGTAYAAMLQNPAFGVGGCFALSLLLVRITFFNKIQKYANQVFLSPEHRLRACPTCGQECVPTSRA